MRKDVTIRADLFALSLLWACRSDFAYHCCGGIFGWREHILLGAVRSLTYFLLSTRHAHLGVYGLLACLHGACLPLIAFRLSPCARATSVVVILAAAISRQPCFLAMHAMLMVMMMRQVDGALLCATIITCHLTHSLVLSGVLPLDSCGHYAMELGCMLTILHF